MVFIYMLLDGNGVFAANLGSFHEPSTWYSGMRICWRILPSADTG